MVIYILIFIIFLLFIIYFKKNIESFKNNSNKSKLYKENTDLSYATERINKSISKKQNIKTNQIAPILSDKDLKIPIPSFQSNKINYKHKSKFNKTKKIVDKTRINQDLCKFVPSYTKDLKCPIDYPVRTGANFSVNTGIISCNNTPIYNHTGSAIAIIENGKIKDIIISSTGNYYKKKKIKLLIKGGGGSGAVVYSTIKNKKLDKIIIKNKGIGYTSTPNVIIPKPNIVETCNLCCKSQI